MGQMEELLAAKNALEALDGNDEDEFVEEEQAGTQRQERQEQACCEAPANKSFSNEYESTEIGSHRPDKDVQASNAHASKRDFEDEDDDDWEQIPKQGAQ